MRILIVGAGCDVTFLVREKTRHWLLRDGLVVRSADSATHATQVTAVTQANLQTLSTPIIVGVRAAAVPDALTDIVAAVGPTTIIIPVVNGMAHLQMMIERYGSLRVCGGVATMATSMTRDGVIEETRLGATPQIGTLEDTPTDRIAGASGFGPSMYRDMTAGRPVEIDILAELADRGKRHQVVAPLLDASLVALSVHNAALSAAETR